MLNPSFPTVFKTYIETQCTFLFHTSEDSHCIGTKPLSDKMSQENSNLCFVHFILIHRTRWEKNIVQSINGSSPRNTANHMFEKIQVSNIIFV